MPRGTTPHRRDLVAIAGGLCGLAAGLGCSDHLIMVVGPWRDGAVEPKDATVEPGDGALPICSTELIGFAGLLTGTTGGAAGATVTVTNEADLRTQTDMDVPLVIRIDGTITVSGAIDVKPDKSIEGVGAASGLTGGGLMLKDTSNVIVRNLIISKPVGSMVDAITVQHSFHIWVDHCELYGDLANPKGTFDDLIDINHGSDYITMSWTRLHDHYDVSFIGHSDSNAAEDVNHLTVTYHHNWFHDDFAQNPSLRFGVLHAFNNHYQNITTTGIVSRMGGQVVAERNYFDTVGAPLLTHSSDSPMDGFLTDADNKFVGGLPTTPLPPATWKPPYDYARALDAVADVPVIVDHCAGTGRI